MKVLILTVTAGYGHHATANALSDEFTSRGAEVTIVDFCRYVSSIMYGVVDKGYLFSTKYMPKSYGNAYSTLEESEKMRDLIMKLEPNSFSAKRFEKFFEDYTPDVIIATHVFAAQALNELKHRGYLTAPVIGIITDYCIHPFWETLYDIDYIVTASELLSFSAEKRGILPSQILPYGIPIRRQFSKKLEKAQARALLGLDNEKRTVLVMSGSMGYGDMFSIVTEIDSMGMDLQLICICGNNKAVYEKLADYTPNSLLTVCGFVDNVELYMDAADCIVTKPGGLTVTEVMSRALPLILVHPIPGQEERNVDFLMNNGGAIFVSKSFSVSEAVYYIFSNPDRLRLMRESLRLIAHPDAAERICSFAMELAESRSSSQEVEEVAADS